MSDADAQSADYRRDLGRTLDYRAKLDRNVNLLSWYAGLYHDLFADVPDLGRRRILEVGSGTSVLKRFVPNAITSDLLRMDHVDLVLDCHRLDELSSIPDHSLDLITLTNVLHHLHDPVRFLRAAPRKLAPGGGIYLAEPFFSIISSPIYRLLHHEPVDFSIDRPVLPEEGGPLSGANQAIPHMLFFRRPEWLAVLTDRYDLQATWLGHYSSLAYMATGGIGRRIPIPGWLYRPFLRVDTGIARRWPELFASFFLARLRTRSRL